MNLWIEAVKEWNATKNKGAYKIPKTGTAEYRQVKAIMSKLEKKHKKDVKGGGFLGLFDKPSKLQTIQKRIDRLNVQHKQRPNDDKIPQLIDYYETLKKKELSKNG